MIVFNKVKLQMVRENSTTYEPQGILNAHDAVSFVNSIERIDTCPEECIYLICLNTKCRVVNYTEIAKGGINSCSIDIKTIFKNVLLANASRFILVHNHPSGDSTPSKTDYKLTKRIKQAAEIMNIDFIDHIVVGAKGYSSCF